jgi:hypothetical protein
MIRQLGEANTSQSNIFGTHLSQLRSSLTLYDKVQNTIKNYSLRKTLFEKNSKKLLHPVTHQKSSQRPILFIM